MGELSPWHLLILAGVFVLLFGAKRLPDGARSLGRSLRIFKTEVKGLNDDDAAAPTQATQTPAAGAAPQPQAQLPAAGAPTEPPTAPPAATTADVAQHQHETR